MLSGPETEELDILKGVSTAGRTRTKLGKGAARCASEDSRKSTQHRKGIKDLGNDRWTMSVGMVFQLPRRAFCFQGLRQGESMHKGGTCVSG